MAHLALRRTLTGALHTQPSASVFDPSRPPDRGDHDLNDSAPEPYARALGYDGLKPRPAAVLVPILAHSSGPTVLLTVRSAHLPSHAGQIAFPGGKIDPTDADARAAALREASEEVGLASKRVDVMGYLDSYQTGTAFRIVPVVGLITPDVRLRAEPGEVDRIFEVPLAFLLDQANHQRHSRPFQGAERHFYAIPYGDHYIWGATAGILRNLSERLDP